MALNLLNPLRRVFNNTNIGTTTTAGLTIQNKADAAAGAQQISPALEFLAQGWKTDSTAATQEVAFRLELLPVQAAANPTATLRFMSSINGGSWAEEFAVESGGGTAQSFTSVLLGDGSVSTPSLRFTSEADSGIYRIGTDDIGIATGGVERVSISSAATIFNEDQADVDFRVESNTLPASLFVDGGADAVLIGHSVATNLIRLGQRLGIATADDTGSKYGGFGVTTFSATNGVRALIDIKKSANATLGDISTDVAASEGLGVIVFRGTAGSTYVTAAEIQADVSASGTISSSSLPGRLAFRVTADGATGGTERLAIEADGKVTMPSLLTIEADGGIVMPGLLESGSAGNAVHRNTSTEEIFEYTSSARFKDDIRSLDATDSDILGQLQAKRYQPKDSEGTVYPSEFGLIAEEVHAVEPALVNMRRVSTMRKNRVTGVKEKKYTGDPVPYGVRYEALSVLLLGKVQELQARLVALEGEADV